jgi:hypothetical protein
LALDILVEYGSVFGGEFERVFGDAEDLDLAGYVGEDLEVF